MDSGNLIKNSFRITIDTLQLELKFELIRNFRNKLLNHSLNFLAKRNGTSGKIIKTFSEFSMTWTHAIKMPYFFSIEPSGLV
jgi:hypothetical protein